MNESGACLNCGAPLTGTYCSSCGQKVPHGDLTLGEFLHDITHELSHWEGKVPKTLKALFFKPGLLTQDFLAGRRARWLPPLRVYLICSVAYFVSGPLIESVTHRAAKQNAAITVSDANGNKAITPELRAILDTSIVGRTLGPARAERLLEDSSKLNREWRAGFPKAMFVLLPVFAFLTSLAWRRAQPRYPAHLYLALHLHAAWFGAFTFVNLVSALIPVSTVSVNAIPVLSWREVLAVVVALLGMVYVIWYTLAAEQRVFGDSPGKTFGKTLVVMTGYLISLAIVSLALLVYTISKM